MNNTNWEIIVTKPGNDPEVFDHEGEFMEAYRIGKALAGKGKIEINRKESKINNNNLA